MKQSKAFNILKNSSQMRTNSLALLCLSFLYLNVGTINEIKSPRGEMGNNATDSLIV